MTRVLLRLVLTGALPALLVVVWWVASAGSTDVYWPPLRTILTAFPDVWTPERLRADVLLVPHHGSGTSSTAAFLAAVRPAVGIFQVGHRNRYRHPKEEVYARYGELGVQRIRTDQSGAVTLGFGDILSITEYRKQRRRYWYTP